MYVCMMDRDGNKLVHKNIKGNDFEFFLKLIEPYRDDLTVVCECCFNWYWLADACFDANIEFVLGHALYMNQAAEGLNPAPKGGHNRDVWEERILAQYTDPLHRLAVECDMDLIRSYDARIARMEQTLETLAKKKFGRDYDVIRSIPGVGRILTLTILFEIDTISRFPTVKNFSSYSRLVKGSVASAGKVKGLCGGKMGNAYLRWAFGEAAVLLQMLPPIDQALCRNAHLQTRKI